MELVAQLRHFRLSAAPDGRGLRCEPDGLFLAGVSLLHKTSRGLVLRPTDELSALIFAAYGEVVDPGRVSRGLRAAAEALNRGDTALAMMEALHLQFPELDDEAAARIAAVDEFLAKYDPDEPRDWRGRWTTGGAGGPDATQTGTTPNSARGSRAATGDRGDSGASTVGLLNADRAPEPTSDSTSALSSPANAASEIAEVTPDTIDPAAYNGRYHDEVVAEEAATLRSRGEAVLTEVRLQMADGSAGARIDILAFDPQTHIVYGIEVKTGDKPGFTPGQIVVYPHLMMGEAVIATDPRVISLGLIPNFPLMPVPIYLIRQQNRYSEKGTTELDPQKMARYYMGKMEYAADFPLERSFLE
jgi:hypothetical protein